MPSTVTSRLQGLTTSVAVKPPCVTVALSNITLSGLQTISSVAVDEGDRVLVTAQTNGVDNGIWLASTGSWTRALDFDGDLDAVSGTRVLIRNSGIDGIEYELTTADPITIGTTSLVFQRRYGANATYDQTNAEIAAGILPTNYSVEPYNAKRYGAIGDDSTDDTAALQRWLDASAGQTARLPEGIYRITSQLNAPDAVYIVGDGRENSTLKYIGSSTITGGAMLKFASRSAFRVSSLGFQCTQAVIGNLTKSLHLENCVYFDVDNISFSATGASSGTNNISGLVCDQTTSGLVPPRGSGCIRNVLYVVEPTDSGASSSRAIHIKGHASQAIEFVSLIGEGNLEHAYYAVHLENTANCSIQQWQLRGASNTEMVLTNADNTLILSPMLAPAPTVGTGISIDSNSLDTIIVNPNWNFSSGAPAASLTDNGTRTNVIVPGTATGFPVRGRHFGSLVVTETDSTASVNGAFEVAKNAAYDRNGLVVRDQAVGATGNKALLKIERGNDTRNLIEVDILGVNYFRVDANGNTKAGGQLQTDGLLVIPDGITAPSATVGVAKIYVDSSTGDLMVKFGDGVTKTLATDT